MGIDLLRSSSTGCCYGTQDRKSVGASLLPRTSHASQMRWKAHSFCGAERLTAAFYWRLHLKSVIYRKPEAVWAAGVEMKKEWQKLSHVNAKVTLWAEKALTCSSFCEVCMNSTWVGWRGDSELRCDLWRLTQCMAGEPFLIFLTVLFF